MSLGIVLPTAPRTILFFFKYCRLKLSSFGRQQVRNIDILCFICGCTNFNRKISKKTQILTKLVLNPEFFFEKVSKLSLELLKYVEKVLRKCQFCEKNRGGSILRQIRKSAICVRMLFSAKLLTFTPIKVLEYFFSIKMSPVIP